MSLVQTNAIRELLEDAGQRLTAMPTLGFSVRALAARLRAIDRVTLATAAAARLEQHLAETRADTGGDVEA